MKIAISTDNPDFINTFYRKIKEHGNEMINVKVEATLFDCIDTNNADAYILSNSFSYTKKAIDFIKKGNPYIPVILLNNDEEENLNTLIKADIIVSYNSITRIDYFVWLCLHNIYTYYRNFETLNKLTTKMHDVIEFAECKYDPTRRMLYHKEKEVEKLSVKQGGVLEILAINYGIVVKKEIILEKVWHKSDYFAGRSMDVYITGLRKLFTAHEIDIEIKNISNVGLILE